MYTHKKQIEKSGVAAADAKKAIIMLHGRGATAQSISSLQKYLTLENTIVYAPQATNNSWYPYSFLAPEEDNQPALDSALSLIAEIVEEIKGLGIPASEIYFLGFSQGACLSLEYVARKGMRYGGVVAFTGGLIGEQLDPENYSGDLQSTPVLITTGDPDNHVPLSRVEQSVALLEKMNGKVDLKVYKGRMHTIQSEEIQLANELVFNSRH